MLVLLTHVSDSEPCVLLAPPSSKALAICLYFSIDSLPHQYFQLNIQDSSLNFDAIAAVEPSLRLFHFFIPLHCCCCSVTKLCPTLCDPLDCSPPGSSVSSVHGVFPGMSTGVVCHFLLQRIFLDERTNPCLLLWQAYSLPLSHLGSPSLHCRL